MKRGIFALIIVLILILVVSVQPTIAASLFAGNTQMSTYGLKADICTPTSAPFISNYNGESSWVMIENITNPNTPHWVSTGWFYCGGYPNAIPYTEEDIYGYYNLTQYGTHLGVHPIIIK